MTTSRETEELEHPVLRRLVNENESLSCRSGRCAPYRMKQGVDCLPWSPCIYAQEFRRRSPALYEIRSVYECRKAARKISLYVFRGSSVQ